MLYSTDIIKLKCTLTFNLNYRLYIDTPAKDYVTKYLFGIVQDSFPTTAVSFVKRYQRLSGQVIKIMNYDAKK